MYKVNTNLAYKPLVFVTFIDKTHDFVVKLAKIAQ